MALLVGTRFRDDLFGTNGDDTIIGLQAGDYLDGERGNDVIRAGPGPDYASGWRGNDLLYGGDGADTLDGWRQDDVLKGGNGPDLLLGGAGDDRMFGANGPDTLDGGPGDDTMTGGRGADVFVMGADGSNDIVTDWERADRIDVSGLGLTFDDLVIRETPRGNLFIRTGDGTLTLRDVSESQITADSFIGLIEPPVPVGPGRVFGEFTTDFEVDRYSIALDAGDLLTAFTSRGDGGPFVRDTTITVFDPFGVEIAFDDDSGHNLNARVDVEVDDTGIYLIDVAPFDPFATGTYALNIDIA